MTQIAIIRQYRAALRRRLDRVLGRQRDPYPAPPPGTVLSPSPGHVWEAQQAVPALSFPQPASDGDMRDWQKTARQKLASLTGYATERPPPEVTASEPPAACGDRLFRHTHFLRVRPETDVPVHLILPSGAPPAAGWPVVVILVGSTSGVHLAWGDSRVPVDHILLDRGADLGLQAARRGYLAVCIEQVGYGARGERAITKPSPSPTIDAANHALLLGRTLMGEKAMDVSSVLDWLLTTAPIEIDPARLFLFGHSTGGTAALYTAALEPRLCGTLASGCIGRIRDTLMTRRSTDGDGIVPGLLNWFETEDLVALSAPRPFVALSGNSDHIFPFSGAAQVVDLARPAFAALGAAENLAAVEVDGPHRYYAGESWAAFDQVIDPTKD